MPLDGPGQHGNMRRQNRSPLAALPLSAIFDDFASPTGTITGRLTLQGGGVWTILPTGGQANPLTIATAGYLSGSGNSGSNLVYALIQTPATAAKWVTTGTRLISLGILIAQHYSNAGSVNVLLTGPSANAIKGTQVVAGASGSLGTLLAFFYAADFDVFQRRETISGGTVTYTYFLNGRQIGGPLTQNISIPASYAYGFNGLVPTTAGGIVDFIEIGDPATQGMISLYAPARILQKDSDGGLTIRVAGEFSVGAPSSVDYQVRDSLGNILISRRVLPNYKTGTAAYYGAGPLAFSGLAAKIASPPAAGVYVEVWRNDIAGGLSAYSRGGVQKPGTVIYGNGQSLFTHRWKDNSGGGSSVAQAGDWQFYASIGPDAGLNYPSSFNRYWYPSANATSAANYIATLRSIVPALASEPIALMNGGRGGTTCQTRAPVSAGGPGTDNDAQKDGIALGGFNFGSGILNFGQTDADNSVETTMMTYLAATLDSDEAFAQTSGIKYVVEQLGANWTGVDAHQEASRRASYMATVGSSRYYLGPGIADLQHITGAFPAGDNYHLGTGLPEQLRRSAWSWAKMMGYTAFDRSGPKIVSATRAGDTVTVTYDLNGFDSVGVINGSVYGDYAGGQRFLLSVPSTTARGSTLAPTAATAGAITGTAGTAGATQVVTYTFAASTITGPVYVTGPWGSEPFNPLGATGNGPTIRFNMATQASMLAGAKSGEPSVPVQPYYAAGGDYVVAA